MINFCTPNPHKNEENYKKLHVSISLKSTNDGQCQNIGCIRLLGSSGERDYKQVWRQKIGFRSQKLQKLVIFGNFRFSRKFTF